MIRLFLIRESHCSIALYFYGKNRFVHIDCTVLYVQYYTEIEDGVLKAHKAAGRRVRVAGRVAHVEQKAIHLRQRRAVHVELDVRPIHSVLVRVAVAFHRSQVQQRSHDVAYAPSKHTTFKTVDTVIQSTLND